jgi:hypothetical protein
LITTVGLLILIRDIADEIPFHKINFASIAEKEYIMGRPNKHMSLLLAVGPNMHMKLLHLVYIALLDAFILADQAVTQLISTVGLLTSIGDIKDKLALHKINFSLIADKVYIIGRPSKHMSLLLIEGPNMHMKLLHGGIYIAFRGNYTNRQGSYTVDYDCRSTDIS